MVGHHDQPLGGPGPGPLHQLGVGRTEVVEGHHGGETGPGEAGRIDRPSRRSRRHGP